VTIVSKGIAAIGKLAFIALLLMAFVGAMAGVVYMSLSGEELIVPEIVGKDYVESEKELAALGLKIKRRADRASTDKINTVLEQLPIAGETVKTGQMILVVVSKAGVEGEQLPSSLTKDIESDDAEKIEDMISDKPKKPKTNTNTVKKKADTKRDVVANESNSGDGAGKSNSNTGTGGDKINSNASTTGAPKPSKPPLTDKLPVQRPPTGETRPRSTPRP